jgi:hypothetical protein
MNFHYFAYGSNMLPSRLIDRCPSAKLIGVGFGANVALEFSKVSKDGSGKATLVPLAGSTVPGAIFTIDLAEREALDKHEGLGVGYERDDAFPVQIAATGAKIEASTYLATSWDRGLKPFDWYLATVVAGALHHGMAEDHVALLRNMVFIQDDDINRKTRTAAIKAMRDHDISDFRTLLAR